MLKHIKAVYVCDSCDKEDEWVLGHGIKNWLIIKDICKYIKYGFIDGWVRSGEWDCQKHWCPACHTKWEIKK